MEFLLPSVKCPGFCFSDMNKAFTLCVGEENLGRLFSLQSHGGDAGLAASAVFRKSAGIFFISAAVFHAEDVDFDGAESIKHYIVYNAGTRVLYLYPEVLVLHQNDVDNVDIFLKTLLAPPYLTKVLDTPGSFTRYVRRLFVLQHEDSRKLPLSHPDHVVTKTDQNREKLQNREKHSRGRRVRQRTA